MAFHPYGNPTVKRLLAALGLEGRGVKKVALVIECDSMVTAYVVLHPEVNHLEQISEAIAVVPVADVIVDDSANVTTIPLPKAIKEQP